MQQLPAARIFHVLIFRDSFRNVASVRAVEERMRLSFLSHKASTRYEAVEFGPGGARVMHEHERAAMRIGDARGAARDVAARMAAMFAGTATDIVLHTDDEKGGEDCLTLLRVRPDGACPACGHARMLPPDCCAWSRGGAR